MIMAHIWLGGLPAHLSTKSEPRPLAAVYRSEHSHDKPPQRPPSYPQHVNQSAASTRVPLPSKVSSFMPIHCINDMALTGTGISGATRPPVTGAALVGATAGVALVGTAPEVALPCLKFLISFCISCIMASNCAGLASACGTGSGVGLASEGCPLAPERPRPRPCPCPRLRIARGIATTSNN
ncbi:hypothetical protein PVAP13_6NG201512 [Panicum virgatum]|uniref:Uncharacterized protein n=1 Tax=Panicum virgatum TaxID=38727 RepID=A0A8T0QY17_PANVG|nr:hypothetical protein PVAP13_6NG201512 [Panicum virgatum]